MQRGTREIWATHPLCDDRLNHQRVLCDRVEPAGLRTEPTNLGEAAGYVLKVDGVGRWIL
jgi:hypothetical protein